MMNLVLYFTFLISYLQSATPMPLFNHLSIDIHPKFLLNPFLIVYFCFEAVSNFIHNLEFDYPS